MQKETESSDVAQLSDNPSDARSDYYLEPEQQTDDLGPATNYIVSERRVSTTGNDGQVVTGQESALYPQESSASYIMDNFLGIAKVNPSTPPPFDACKFNIKLMELLLKSDSVPVILCLSTLSGLALDAQTLLFKKLITGAINIHEKYSQILQQKLESKCNNHSLSSFSFNIVGSYPFDDPVWLPCSERSSIRFCLLSSIVRLFVTCTIDIKQIEFESLPEIAEIDIQQVEFHPEKIDETQCDAESFAQKHLHWLYDAVLKSLKSLKNEPDKINLLLAGIAILNIFKIAQSKAAYEFLPFVTESCTKLVQLVFLDMERDLHHLHDSFLSDSKECVFAAVHPLKSRIDILCHFAAAGCPKYREPPILFASSDSSDPSSEDAEKLEFLEQKFSENGVKVKPVIINRRNIDEKKKFLEQMIVNNYKFSDTIPLRWVNLLSMILVKQQILLTKNSIAHLALMCGMDANEVELFLKTFTSFGSILYTPNIMQIIIIDIEKFVYCLDKIYNHRDGFASEFGLIPHDTIGTIIETQSESVISMFMSVAKHFCLGFLIKEEKLKTDDVHLKEKTAYYYIPSMRDSVACTDGPSSYSSLYLELNPKYIPGNIQLLLMRYLLKLSNSYLVPGRPINVTTIEIGHQMNGSVQVNVIDHGNIVELKLGDGFDKESCVTVIRACQQALENFRKSHGCFQYRFTLKCIKGGYHDLKEGVCNDCSGIYTHQQHWIESTKECFAKETQDFLSFEEMTSIAMKLADTVVDLEELCQALEVDPERIAPVQDSAQFLVLLSVWGEKNGFKNCSKNRLLDIFNSLGYEISNLY